MSFTVVAAIGAVVSAGVGVAKAVQGKKARDEAAIEKEAAKAAIVQMLRKHKVRLYPQSSMAIRPAQGGGGEGGGPAPGNDGTNHLGGGGGGCYSGPPTQTSGKGGTGVVIVRYKYK